MFFLQAGKKDPDLRKLGLLDFIVKPVQRVCKYPLFLRVGPSYFVLFLFPFLSFFFYLALQNK